MMSEPMWCEMEDSGRSASPSGCEASQSRIPNADYQRGIDAARAATFHILRLFEVSDDLFYAIDAATYHLRGREMQLAGAMPALTDVELELGAAKNRGILDAIANGGRE